MIITYAITKAELHVAEERLHLLMARKEELYTRFFPLASRMGDTTGHTNKRSDPMAAYVSELEKINPVTNMSLDDELENCQNEIRTLQYYLKRMEYIIKESKGIKNELFCLVIMDGVRPVKAVKQIADKYSIEEDSVWKRHYPKEEISIFYKKSKIVQ